MNDDFEHYIDSTIGFAKVDPPKRARQRFKAGLPKVEELIREICSMYFHNRSLRSLGQRTTSITLYFEAKTFLHGLLVVEDKLSMRLS